VAPLYLLSFLGLHYFSASWRAPATIAAAVGMVFILPWLLIGVRGPVQRKIDRVLYGDRLSHRQAVLTFPKRMGNVLGLKQLAEGMLQDMPKAVHASHVSLLLAANGDFATEYSNQLSASDTAPRVVLSNRSPIAGWLAANDRPLSCESIEVDSEFKGLCGEEREAVRALGISLFVPLNSQGKLVGILAAGRKREGRPYSSDDVDLLATVATESAAALANAQLYAQTKERVHTDELTGLLNHGYFHQRLEEEISRCSRFGSVLSLIFLDVDLFKSYNDAFGHLAGDEVLRQIAAHIKDSIRGVDMAFRYGGDEFAVVLPESSLDDACHVAERIRKRIECEMESKGIAITCSMGIAAWPTDGVAREMVLRAADRALYLSKQKGRNQISLASEAAAAHSNGSDSARESEILSAVHALAATVDAKDANTYGHSKKTSEYAVYVAQALSFPAEKLTEVKASALLHDIGKIRVPDSILVKPGRLNAEEWLAIREHPKFGVAILKHIKGLSGCLPTIQHHHERYDGTGYPAGLTGNDIPLDARILAVADAYDAMTSPRPYRREKMSHQQAVDELARCAGKQFDPEIVRAFERLWDPLDSYVTASGVARLARRTIVPGTKALLLPRATRAR
jgi:diguanylate cyclase (GGDEF)-like protein/putative nucleotidyltransferase with HDIG domain